MNTKHNFMALPSPGMTTANASGAELASSDPPPVIDLKEDELQAFAYICESLRMAGIDHLTAGMPLAVIVGTFSDWTQVNQQYLLQSL